MLNNAGGSFRARALLDSGSGTNFVAGDVLSHLAYKQISSGDVTIAGINTTETKSLALTVVSFYDYGCPIKYLKCYVMPGMLSYKVDDKRYKSMINNCKNVPGIINPFIEEVDQGNGIGFILGPGAVRDLSPEVPIYHKSFLIDGTDFGPAVSGRLPNIVF